LSRKQVLVAGVREDAAPGKAKAVAKPAGKGKNVGAAAEVEQSVAASMDALKEQIFRLELRRQAGTISEEDYASEKAKFDKLLRGMVQG
jgi:hypothetical protein